MLMLLAAAFPFNYVNSFFKIFVTTSSLYKLNAELTNKALSGKLNLFNYLES